MHSWDLLCIHAIGVPERVTLMKFKGAHPEEEQVQPKETEVQIGEGVPEEEQPEYPDHHPSSFLKDKPWCMLTQLLYI
jgi:hypothetical protein